MNMEQNLLLYLILAQILLTIIVYISLGFAKAKAMKLGQVDLERRDNHPEAWPDSVLQINNEGVVDPGMCHLRLIPTYKFGRLDHQSYA